MVTDGPCYVCYPSNLAESAIPTHSIWRDYTLSENCIPNSFGSWNVFLFPQISSKYHKINVLPILMKYTFTIELRYIYIYIEAWIVPSGILNPGSVSMDHKLLGCILDSVTPGNNGNLLPREIMKCSCYDELFSLFKN